MLIFVDNCRFLWVYLAKCNYWQRVWTKNGRHEIVTTGLFEGLFLKRKMCRFEKF